MYYVDIGLGRKARSGCSTMCATKLKGLSGPAEGPPVVLDVLELQHLKGIINHSSTPVHIRQITWQFHMGGIRQVLPAPQEHNWPRCRTCLSQANFFLLGCRCLHAS